MADLLTRPLAEGTLAAPSVLELRDIVLDYPDGVDEQGNPRTMRALDHVNLTASRGEFIALTGASGSGKSSLLSVAAGLITPTAGACLINGTDTTAYKDADLAALRRTDIGIIFQRRRTVRTHRPHQWRPRGRT